MQANIYVIIIVLMGIAFFLTGILVLYWCAKNGQLQNFDKGSRSIFNDEEPEGVQTDFFPGERNKLNNKKKF